MAVSVCHVAVHDIIIQRRAQVCRQCTAKVHIENIVSAVLIDELPIPEATAEDDFFVRFNTNNIFGKVISD